MKAKDYAVVLMCVVAIALASVSAFRWLLGVVLVVLIVVGAMWVLEQMGDGRE